MALLGLAGCGGGQGGDAPQAAAAPTLSDCTLFPANAVFNSRIDDLPVHPGSADWVNAIGSDVGFHGDWGSNDNPDVAPYDGIPSNAVDGSAATTAWPLIGLDYQDESDCAIRGGDGRIRVQHDCSGAAATQARFPFPDSAHLRIEGGNLAFNRGDRHVLVVETGACRLWETAYAYPQADGSWLAGGVAEWDLSSNAMRPDAWTSADAAGLPMLPLLVRAAEAQSGEIRHAFRVTFLNPLLGDRLHVWPATHAAGNDGGGDIPFGALLRLKASFVIPQAWGPQARAIAVAMQRYGLYVADNGSNLFVQGEPSAQWDPALLSQLSQMRMADFEFVDTGVIRSRAGFSAQSFAVPAP